MERVGESGEGREGAREREREGGEGGREKGERRERGGRGGTELERTEGDREKVRGGMEGETDRQCVSYIDFGFSTNSVSSVFSTS